MKTHLLIGIVLTVFASACGANPVSTAESVPIQSASPSPSVSILPSQTVALPTKTLPPTVTPTPASPWEGVWNVKVYSTVSNKTWTGQAEFSVDGSKISGMFQITNDDESFSYTFSGNLDETGTTAIGTWTLNKGGTGKFVWHLRTNLGQFIGNLSPLDYEMCGARKGYKYPNPCMGP